MGVGKIYFVGAGPGDPGLLTLKARRAIKQADVIIYDRLVNFMLLQLSKPECQLIYVGKNPDNQYMQQPEINALINQQVAEGKVVVRLKGGDPAIFGRLTEEVESLGDTVQYEVIPGITSASAAALYSGFPLTDRQYAPHVTFATGHLQKDSVKEIDFQALAKGGTLALYMGMKELPNIVEVLMTQNDGSLPIAVIGYASYGYQKTVISTLEDIIEDVREREVTHPAMILIGDVVKCRHQASWFEQLPSFGKKTLVVSEQKIDVETFLEQYDDGGYYYLIDHLNDQQHQEKYHDIHQQILNEVAFDVVLGDAETVERVKQQYTLI